MPTYVYRAYRQNQDSGDPVTGEISAESLSDAINELQQSGLVVESIEQADEGVGDQPDQNLTSRSNQANNDRDRLQSLAPALSALAEEMPAGKVKRELSDLATRLRRGESIEKLQDSPTALFWLSRFGLHAADDSVGPKLTAAMSEASKISMAHSQKHWLLTYTVFVAALGLLVFVLLGAVIVPEFDEMYDEFGMRLPGTTSFLLGLSRQLTHDPVGSLLGLLVCLFGVFCFVRLWRYFACTTRWFGSVVAGNSMSVEAMAKLTGLLAERLEVGGSVAQSLRFAAQHCDHRYYRQMANQLSAQAEQGLSAMNESRAARVFPKNVIMALGIGTGKQPNTALLRELSEMYFERARSRLSWSRGIASPLVIIGLGALVAFTVMALFMPLFSLISGLSG